MSLPAADTIRAFFGSWNAALEAAGLPAVEARQPPFTGKTRPNYTREEKIARFVGVGVNVECARTAIQIEPGTHTLQLVYYLGLTSPTVTFGVSDGETADFVCHAPPFVLVVPRLVASLFQRSRWIALTRT